MLSQGIGLELTGRCNLDCVHCLRDKKDSNRDFPIILLEKLLKEAKFYHKPYIALTGGEVTVYPNFIDIVKLIKSKGYSYTLITNGWNFCETFNKMNKKYGKACMPYNSVCFSLDGATAKIHDAIRGKGSFDRVREAMRFCKKYKISFGLQMVVNHINENEVDALADLANKIGVGYLSLGITFPTPDLVEKKLQLSPKEGFRLYKKIRKLNFKYSKLHIFPAVDFYADSYWVSCRFLKTDMINFDFKGNLTFCCQLSGWSGSGSASDIVGSLKDNSFITLKQKLIHKIAQFQKDRLGQFKKNNFDFLDHFSCFSCARYFGKVDWLDKYPESDWYYRRDKNSPPKTKIRSKK